MDETTSSERPAVHLVTEGTLRVGGATGVVAIIVQAPAEATIPVTVAGVVTETLRAGDVAKLVIDPATGHSTIRPATR